MKTGDEIWLINTMGRYGGGAEYYSKGKEQRLPRRGVERRKGGKKKQSGDRGRTGGEQVKQNCGT